MSIREVRKVHAGLKVKLGVSGAFTMIEVMISMTILVVAMSAVSSSLYSLNQANKVISENRKASEIAQVIMERVQGANWSALGQTPWSWHRRANAESAGDDTYVDQLSSEGSTKIKYRPMIDEPETRSKNIYRYLDDTFGSAEGKMKDFPKDPYGLPYVSAGQYGPFNFTTDSGAPAVSVPSSIVTHYNQPQRYNWLQFLGIIDAPSGLSGLKIYMEYYEMSIMEASTSRKEWVGNIDGTSAGSYELPQSHLALNLDEITDMDSNAVIVRIYMVWKSYDGSQRNHEVVLARRR